MTVTIEARAARPTCAAARASLGAYVRAGLPNRAAHRVSAHLECCRACTGIYLDLVERPSHGQNTMRVPLWRRV